MRRLATVSISFSFAILTTIYFLPSFVLLPAAVLSGLFCVLFFLIRSRSQLYVRLALICCGLSVGLFWYLVYTHGLFSSISELDNQTIRLRGIATDYPDRFNGGYQVPLSIQTQDGHRLSTLLRTDEQGASIQPGDSISTIAHGTPLDLETSYYPSSGIFLQFQAYGTLLVERPDHIQPMYWPAVLAQWLKLRFQYLFPSPAAGLIQALILGDRSQLPETLSTALERTGLSHTVAVSGMHLSCLTSLLVFCFGRGRVKTVVLLLVLSLFFCGMAGNTPSVWRATMMLIPLQFAPLVRREPDSPTALCLALALLLAHNPFSAAHLGLQLSFASVAGILLFSEPLQTRIQTILTWGPWKSPFKSDSARRNYLQQMFCSAVSVGISATLLTTPLIILHFQSFSLLSVLSNLLLLWCVWFLFTGALLAAFTSLFCPTLSQLFTVPVSLLAHGFLWTVTQLANFPFTALNTTSSYYTIWLVFLFVLASLSFGMRSSKPLLIPTCSAMVTLLFSFLLTALSFRSGSMTITALDVGQGQCILLRLGSFLTVVDCGGSTTDNPGDLAANQLQSLGYTSIPLLILTHCHDDHANGIPRLLERMEVQALALPAAEEDSPLRREILSLAQEQETELWFIEQDTCITLETGETFILYAPLEGGTDANELGLSVLASVPSFDVLITGDMDSHSERRLLAHTELPDLELLVVGHHGSAYSSCEEFLENVHPELAILSVGRYNQYGHPAPETLARLNAIHAAIYRTDLMGTITVHVS